MLSCATPYKSMSCYVLCCDMLCHTSLYYGTICKITVHYVTLCHETVSYVSWQSDVLTKTMLYFVIIWYTVL